MALAARLSTRAIGITVADFATSSPELSVAINSALAGAPSISLGDALGSNVVNVGLILALAALIAPIPSRSEGLTRDFVVALMVAPVVGVLALDGQLSRLDGKPRILAIVLHCLSGLARLVIAGRLVVQGAQGIGFTLDVAGSVVASGLFFGVLTLILALPRGGVIGRCSDLALLACYVAYSSCCCASAAGLTEESTTDIRR